MMTNGLSEPSGVVIWTEPDMIWSSRVETEWRHEALRDTDEDAREAGKELHYLCGQRREIQKHELNIEHLSMNAA